MSLRVVGAGFGRTGTHSLKIALEQLLGAPCYHMVEVFQHPEHVADWHSAATGIMPNWDKLFNGYAAAVDWPASAFWPELSEYYPDALVLLSLRDAEAWWRSTQNTIFKDGGDHGNPAWRAMLEALFEARFTSNLHDHDECVAAFNNNNNRAKKAISPDRLLVWQASDGWEPICQALGVPVPSTPFPLTNTSEDWARNREKAAEEESSNG